MELPVIIVTDELRALAAATDFTQMTDDEFMAWLLSHATERIDPTIFDKK